MRGGKRYQENALQLSLLRWDYGDLRYALGLDMDGLKAVLPAEFDPGAADMVLLPRRFARIGDRLHESLGFARFDDGTRGLRVSDVPVERPKTPDQLIASRQGGFVDVAFDAVSRWFEIGLVSYHNEPPYADGPSVAIGARMWTCGWGLDARGGTFPSVVPYALHPDGWTELREQDLALPSSADPWGARPFRTWHLFGRPGDL